MLDAETRSSQKPGSLSLRARSVATNAAARTGAVAFTLLLLLAVSAGADRALWRVGDTNLRFELVLGLLALAVALLYYRSRALAAMGAIEWLLVGWLGLNVVSSVAFSPRPSESLRSSLVLVGLLAIYLAVVLLLRSRSAALWATCLWVATGAAVALLGLVEAVLFTVAGSTQGISLHRAYSDGELTVVPMVTGTIWEPNLYGAFSLSAGLVAASLALAPERAGIGEKRVLWACVALCFSGVVLSMTRTVWLVGVAGVLVLAVAAGIIASRRGERPVQPWLGAVLVGVAVGTVIALAMPRVQWSTADPWELSYGRLEERVGNEVRAMRRGDASGSAAGSALAGRIGELNSWESAPTLVARQNANALALDLWRERPWLGWGTDAFRHVAQPEPHAPAWVPNVILHVLFDTGVAGLVVLGLAVVLAGFRAVRAFAKPARLWQAGDFALLGLVVASGALVLCYQMTDGTWMGFTWFTFALLVVSARYAVTSPRDA